MCIWCAVASGQLYTGIPVLCDSRILSLASSIRVNVSRAVSCVLARGEDISVLRTALCHAAPCIQRCGEESQPRGRRPVGSPSKGTFPKSCCAFHEQFSFSGPGGGKTSIRFLVHTRSNCRSGHQRADSLAAGCHRRPADISRHLLDLLFEQCRLFLQVHHGFCEK